MGASNGKLGLSTDPDPWKARVSTLIGCNIPMPFFSKKSNILVVGIDGSGKSTLINYAKPSSQQRPGELVPTIGCSVEEVKRGNMQLTVFDMAGGSKYRNLWARYFAEADGVVYVIDSADAMRMAISRQELQEMLAHPVFKSRCAPILFLANKMDLPHSMAHQAIAENMGLAEIAHQHTWKIMRCCGITGEGVQEGWDWLVQQLSQTSNP